MGCSRGRKHSELGSIQSYPINATGALAAPGNAAIAFVAVARRVLSGLVSIRDAKAYEQSNLLGQWVLSPAERWRARLLAG